MKNYKHNLSNFIKPIEHKKPKRTNSDNKNNPWYFNDEPLVELPAGFYGFVYVITNLINGKKYIGKKYFISVSGKGKRSIKKESNWRSYWSSSSSLKADILKYGKFSFKREILVICRDKRDVDLQEVRLLWVYNVLGAVLKTGEPEFYNDNISGKYYRRDELYDNSARLYSSNI